MTMIITVICLSILSVTLLGIVWHQYKSKLTLKTRNDSNKFKIKGLEEQVAALNERVGKAELPLTIESVQQAVRDAGYTPRTSGHYVIFKVNDSEVFIDCSQLPQVYFSIFYNIDSAKEDVSLVRSAALAVTEDMFMAKATVGENDGIPYVKFFVGAVEHGYPNFRDNLDNYVWLLFRTYQKSLEYYHFFIRDRAVQQAEWPSEPMVVPSTKTTKISS